MLPRAIKFGYVVIVLAAAMLSFVTLRGHDELATAGSSYLIQLDKPDAGAGAAEVAGAVEAFARQQRINIGRLYDDPRDPGERTVFLAVGDTAAPSTSWLNSRYPGFSPAVNLHFRPYQESRALTADGRYLVYGSQQQSLDLVQAFKELGYHGASTPVPSLGTELQKLGAGALTTFVLAIALVIVVTVASSVVLNTRSYGIQRLHGHSPARMIAGDFRRVLLLAAVTVVGVNLLLALPLYLYNGFHQVGMFLRVELIIAAALIVLALVVQALTVMLLQSSPITEAIGGRITAGWAFAGAYLLRGWSLLLILSIASSSLTAFWTLTDARESQRTWAAAGEAYCLRVSAAIEYSKNAAQLDTRIGQALRKADERGEVTIAARYNLFESKRDLLMVDESYLSKHDVRDANGRRVTPGTNARLLVPARYGAQAARIEDELPRWAAVALQGKAPDLQAEPILDGQTLLSSTTGTGNRTPLVRDAVVLVVPAASGIIGDGAYTTMATNGGILVENPERITQAMTSAGVGDYILGVTPFAYDAGQRYLEARRDAGIQLVNLLIGVALLIFTALAIAFVYSGRNAQSLFAKHLHGWGFLRTHWRLLALEAAIGIALLVWTWSGSAAVLARSRVPTLPPLPAYVVDGATWKPVLAGGVVLIAVTLAAGAVRWLSPDKEIR
ncbi:hypothetical protein OHA70_32505 [Kribbella sp. NBC_00382]|uniref:hypothetical protein n=1 Tax=Kribbella sp. NBC_00382 TaxID=2975967 RepID=UPI002E1DA759